MMARRSSIIVQNLVKIERLTSAWEVWCISLFCTFVCTFVMLSRPTLLLITRVISTRNSVGNCRPIQMGFTAFFSEKKSRFNRKEQIWKSSLGGATISAPMHVKIFKIWENGCNVDTTSAIYKQDERKVLPMPFAPCIVDVNTYKNILLPRYRISQKLSSS